MKIISLTWQAPSSWRFYSSADVRRIFVPLRWVLSKRRHVVWSNLKCSTWSNFMRGLADYWKQADGFWLLFMYEIIYPRSSIFCSNCHHLPPDSHLASLHVKPRLRKIYVDRRESRGWKENSTFKLRCKAKITHLSLYCVYVEKFHNSGNSRSSIHSIYLIAAYSVFSIVDIEANAA